ncbi:hypothetical protein BWI97_05800 [Siphonobacter sp. BAB-5405]|uniref:T9SS type B sorting domain-containing protein n=1 Tax=Siphonobacter sp. BAB-5405 TaxID=1864825 RepID=UPI000C8053F3|nr:T9SS type B sorting domain-containing protein [Siphonobacter sp. BAB-5405]PMD98193.1 hypothetical protein BWI97_05800 [Siphonobacter sp. BAB-5405]
MRIRILLLLLGIVWEGWAQCPTKLVNGTQDYKGRLQVSSSQGTTMIAEGTSDRILKICKGTTIQVEDVTANNNPSLTAYNFNYQSAEVDLSAPLFDKVNKSYTYAKAGTYGLIMVGSASGTGSYACQTVQVLGNPDPNFEVDACEIEQVTLVIPKDSSRNPYDEFTVEWGDGNTEKVLKKDLPLTKVHIYKNAGTGVAISVQGTYEGNICSSSKVSKFIDPGKLNQSPKPIVTLLELSATKTVATIQFAGPVSTTQEIFQKEVGGTYVSTGIQIQNNLTSERITNLNPTKQYCFQVRSVGGCASSSGSDEICTLPITVVAKAKQMEVNWSAYPQATAAFESYTVSNGTTTFPVITDRTQTQLIDQSELECGTSYCYRVTARVNNINSISNEVCEEIESTVKPDPITQAYATLAGKAAVLTWESPGGKILDYEILRAEAGSKLEKIEPDTTIVNPYKDRQINPLQRSYCYQISYESACKTWSNPSAAVCTIYLSQKGGELFWTSNNPFTEDLSEYTVQALDAQGNVVASSNVAKATSISVSSLGFPISPDYEYRIQSTSASGHISWSNSIPIQEFFQVYVPDAFTPNGDSQNDVFLPKVLHVNALKLTVFDRWGNSIFSTEDESEGWDGSINGKPAPQGSYSYRLDVRNELGDSFTKRGVFRLIR